MIRFLVMTVFPVLVAYAAISDFRTRRIPNWLNLTIAGAFFPLAFLTGMELSQMGWHLAAFGATFALGLFIFFTGLAGGGDAKLLPAVGIWIGWNQHLVDMLLYTAIIGGVLGGLTLLWRALRLEADVWAGGTAMKKLFTWEMTFPYGIPIAAAALIVYPATRWGEFLF